MKNQSTVVLNVGGQRFTTLKSTIEPCEYFRSLFSDQWNSITQDEIFLDRDPASFSKFLTFLRYNDVEALPNLEPHERFLLEQECQYFGLPLALTSELTQPSSQETICYGDIVYMKGLEGNVFLTQNGDKAEREANQSKAVPLVIVPFSASQLGEPILVGHMFHLQIAKNLPTTTERASPFRCIKKKKLEEKVGLGKYFHRTTLMYDDKHWKTGRFSLGFVDNPTQFLWIPVGSTAQGLRLQRGEPIKPTDFFGLMIGGHQNVSSTDPNNTNHRYLTLRDYDQPVNVVDFWAGHERIEFVRAFSYNKYIHE